MKVELVKRRGREGWRAEESREVQLRASLPFFFSPLSSRVHRVRSGTAYYWVGNYTHTALALWCGQSGFLDGKKHKNNVLTADPPKSYPICGTCEGRARGYGQLESHLIAGRMVTFTPRS
jgi:hypothetical protein